MPLRSEQEFVQGEREHPVQLKTGLRRHGPSTRIQDHHIEEVSQMITDQELVHNNILAVRRNSR